MSISKISTPLSRIAMSLPDSAAQDFARLARITRQPQSRMFPHLLPELRRRCFQKAGSVAGGNPSVREDETFRHYDQDAQQIRMGQCADPARIVGLATGIAQPHRRAAAVAILAESASHLDGALRDKLLCSGLLLTDGYDAAVALRGLGQGFFFHGDPRSGVILERTLSFTDSLPPTPLRERVFVLAFSGMKLGPEGFPGGDPGEYPARAVGKVLSLQQPDARALGLGTICSWWRVLNQDQRRQVQDAIGQLPLSKHRHVVQQALKAALDLASASEMRETA